MHHPLDVRTVIRLPYGQSSPLWGFPSGSPDLRGLRGSGELGAGFEGIIASGFPD